MSNIFGITAVAWVLVVFCLWMPTPGSALKCHVCNSLQDEPCESIKNDIFLKDCALYDLDQEQNHTNCRKQVFSTYSKKFDMHTERTVRSCGFERHYRQSCFYSSNIDLKSTTCECTEDGCNGGNMLHFASKVLLNAVLCGFLASLLAT